MTGDSEAAINKARGKDRAMLGPEGGCRLTI
jgi:hypothetical protein